MNEIKKLINICYVLKSFPNPSETFISDEASSMYDFGVLPHILTFNEGNSKVIHPTAEKLINSGVVTLVKQTSRGAALKAVCALFMQQPLRTLLCLAKALKSPERWIFFQASPYALSLLNNKIDFIHAHFADFNAIWTEILSEWTGIHFGVTTHRYDLLNDPISISRCVQIFSKASLVVTISNFNRNLMVQKYKIPFDKINIVHCGVDLNRFKFSESSERFRQKQLRLINVGRLVPEKGQDILIQALSEVKSRGVEFHLKIIGDGPLRDELINLSKKLNLYENIQFMGAQPQDYLISMLNESDAFVLSSLSEGLPVACIEAMATGTFLIATRINGIPELVQDRITGLLFESKNISELANAICWADENKKLLKSMCIHARNIVECEFDRLKCTEIFIKNINTSINNLNILETL